MQVCTEFTQGSADGWGMEHRPGTRQGGLHVCIGGRTRPPGVQQRFCQIPVGMAASREGFANAGGPKAQPNRAMLAQCVRKFRETPVFLGHNKRTGTRVPRTSRHVLSSKYVYSFGEEFRFVAAAFFGVGWLCA